VSVIRSRGHPPRRYASAKIERISADPRTSALALVVTTRIVKHQDGKVVM
jgi:hypothetical protein